MLCRVLGGNSVGKLQVEIRPIHELVEADRRAIRSVFSQGFDHEKDAGQCLESYFSSIQSICIARDGASIVGFQFYQEKEIDRRQVHHFSLAARLPDKKYRGLQSRFGTALIRRVLTKVVPWKPVYIAGVTNNPKSYANMHAVGGRCYPDVLHPLKSNPFGDWYLQVAEQLNLMPVDGRGLLRDRMQGLGFSMQSTCFGDHPIGRAYGDYVEQDIRHGVFTLIEVVPLRDISLYLFKRMLSRG